MVPETASSSTASSSARVSAPASVMLPLIGIALGRAVVQAIAVPAVADKLASTILIRPSSPASRSASGRAVVLAVVAVRVQVPCFAAGFLFEFVALLLCLEFAVFRGLDLGCTLLEGEGLAFLLRQELGLRSESSQWRHRGCRRCSKADLGLQLLFLALLLEDGLDRERLLPWSHICNCRGLQKRIWAVERERVGSDSAAAKSRVAPLAAPLLLYSRIQAP